METFIKILFDFFRSWGDVFPRPAYDVHPKDLLMNQDIPIPISNVVPVDSPKSDPRAAIVAAVMNGLGKDATPKDEVPDDVACVASVAAILAPTDHALPGSPTFTPVLLQIVRAQTTKWRATLTPSSGCLIISPSVSETNHGHCGIFLSSRRIASNNSATGIWEDNYSFENWVNYFKTKKGLHIYIFEPI